MKLKALAAAALLATGAVSSHAAAGDVVFSTGFFKTVLSTGTFADTFSWASLAAGVYKYEAATVATGLITFSDVTFNGVSLIGTDKFRVGEGETGPTLDMIVSGNSTGIGTYAGSVTITMVPEPETYALMLAGLGAVGFMARRRQRG